MLDPFCGVGTTNLTCKQHGINSIGFDTNPLAILVSEVKTTNYNLESLSKLVKEVTKWKFSKPKALPNKYFQKAFSKANLEYITFYKNKISEINEPKIRNFLLLALIDAATKSSWTVKEGVLLRIKRRPTPPVGKLFKYKIKKMLHDLKRNPLPFVKTRIELCDARNLKLKENSIDIVITSPPYLNIQRHSPKAYKLELSLFFGTSPNLIKQFGEGENVEEAYWSDTKKVLKELFRVCKPRAKIAWITGGGCFPDRVVPVGDRTAEIAQSIGFSIEKILIARKTWCTRKRTIKVGLMSESILLFQKT